MKIISAFCLLAILTNACSSDNSSKIIDENVIISADVYDQTNSDNYKVKRASIEGDILTITIQSSGCDGSSWVSKLIDSGLVAESYPVQRFAKISLQNSEACLAIVTKELTFDISSLRVEDQLYLNLEGSEEQLHYDF